ncbi:MAG: Major facilitator superfamily [Parcubacteria group bacterium GW2011_GWD2_42_14]|nr:MAG: Major facilitator superfamily [Parcubacteria group bacterium GW2011_GWD2_42_14]
MERKKALRNIALYKWYIIFREPLMWGPILISCLTQLGHMKLEEIYFMEAIVLLGFIFLEPPSGALADLIGRKKMIVIGAGCEVVSIVWFSYIQTPVDVWGANIVWMIGASFASGANTSLIYDTLVELDMEHTYEKLESIVVSHFLLVTAIFSLLSGVLAGVHLRLPIVLSIPGVLICFCIALCFTETGDVEKKVKKHKITLHEMFLILKTTFKAINKLMKVSLLFVANNKEIKWIVCFSTLITVASKVWFFTYNPYFELVHLDVRYYGLVFFWLNVVAWFFCKNAYRIKSRLGEARVVTLLLFAIVVPITVMGTFVGVLSISLVLMQNVVRGMARPFFSAFLHKHITSEKRATVDSIGSAVNGLCQFLALGMFGVMLSVWQLSFCLQMLGLTVLVLGVYSLCRYHTVFR